MHYPWVNLNRDLESGEREETKAELHAKELFMCGQHDMIAIGGGSVFKLVICINQNNSNQHHESVSWLKTQI